jgi:hypothetical protein
MFVFCVIGHGIVQGADATGSYTAGLFGLSGMLALAALSALLIEPSRKRSHAQ